MEITFWKLSQGTEQFSPREILESIDRRLVFVHKDTRPKATSSSSQAEDFITAKIGDYFYLTHGNAGIYALGQFTGPANVFSTRGNGWLDRPFRFIRGSTTRDSYTGEHKWWSPNDNSTFMAVPDDEIALFEKSILIPHFEISLKDFGFNP